MPAAAQPRRSSFRRPHSHNRNRVKFDSLPIGHEEGKDTRYPKYKTGRSISHFRCERCSEALQYGWGCQCGERKSQKVRDAAAEGLRKGGLWEKGINPNPIDDDKAEEAEEKEREREQEKKKAHEKKKAREEKPRRPVAPADFLNYYTFLNIDPKATQKEMEKLTKKARCEAHPDRARPHKPTPEQEKEIAEKSKLVGQMSDVLCNAGERFIYDGQLAAWQAKQREPKREPRRTASQTFKKEAPPHQYRDAKEPESDSSDADSETERRRAARAPRSSAKAGTKDPRAQAKPQSSHPKPAAPPPRTDKPRDPPRHDRPRDAPHTTRPRDAPPSSHRPRPATTNTRAPPPRARTSSSSARHPQVFAAVYEEELHAGFGDPTIGGYANPLPGNGRYDEHYHRMMSGRTSTRQAGQARRDANGNGYVYFENPDASYSWCQSEMGAFEDDMSDFGGGFGGWARLRVQREVAAFGLLFHHSGDGYEDAGWGRQSHQPRTASDDVPGSPVDVEMVDAGPLFMVFEGDELPEGI